MPQLVHHGDMGSEAETSRGPAATSPSEREALADVRDRKADQPETLAGKLERRLDERERRLDERERRLDERERRLDERTRAIKILVKRIEESLDLIEDSRAPLTASGESSDRHVAAVKRAGGRGKQEQAVTGAAAGNKPDRVAAPADLRVPIERAIALRKQIRATLAALVATEEEVALVHDKIAAGRPDNTDRYWLTAAQARTRARQLRGIERHFHD